MKIELPMIVVAPGPRYHVCRLPHLGLSVTGPSLAELRDDLALAAMIELEKEAPQRWWRYQLPPHVKLRHVDVKLTVKPKLGKRVELAARVPVLVEKWPADSFWVATPTRNERAAFAIPDPDALAEALPRRLRAYLEQHELTDLKAFHSDKYEHLDVLEIDGEPRSLLPRTQRKVSRGRGKRDAQLSESPADREERRRKRRLTVKALREAGSNLSHGAADDTLDHAFGRDGLVEHVVDELVGRDGAALVLIGPPGVGKTAIVHEVTRRLTARHAAALVRRDVWRLDGGRFVSGQSFVGQWEARARSLGEELAETGDILYADDVASLVFAGRTSGSKANLATYLEPQLARGELTILGESTAERWAKVREEVPGFAAQFRVIDMPPLDARRTLPVLLGVLRDLESEPEAGAPPRLAPAALEALLQAAERFRPHEAFPGKAVRLLRRLCAGAGQAGDGVRRFEVDDVHALLRGETGLPAFVVGGEPPRPREQIRQELAAHVAGQPDAVEAITDVVLAMQAGLGDPDKPLATLLFVGPTGVGKTESAKALASYLFGGPERFLRFDMSEMTSTASLARLTGEPGAPDGELTTALRSQPLRVILFDEIEKAHPRVFDALLQLLGEGRVTDAAGRTADARQAVVLMTSNLGVREAAARSGFVTSGDSAKAHYLGAVRDFFRPEFFNRIDRVVAFQPLDKVALRVVVEHALAELLSRRGVARGGVMVDVEPGLLDRLVEQAYDPRYGARPLKRLLERQLTVPLAHHLATRSGDDLALVELYRRDGEGGGLGLDVRLLVSPERRGDDPATWGLTRVIAELRAQHDELARLRQLPVIVRLTGERAAALAEGRAIREPAGLELLDKLGELASRLAELDPDELFGLHYEERAEDNTPQMKWGRDASSRAGHMGLSRTPRPTYVELPMAADPEAALRGVRPRVIALRDALTVLAHRIACYAARGADQLILLFEAVGAATGEALDEIWQIGCFGLFPLAILVEQPDGDGGFCWQPFDGDSQREVRRRRRTAFVHEAAGLREIASGLIGWALVRPEAIDQLVRIEVAEGGSLPRAEYVRSLALTESPVQRIEELADWNGLARYLLDDFRAAIAVHDGSRAAARSDRRAHHRGEALPPEVIRVHHRRHVETGVQVDADISAVGFDPLHAAILRSR